MNYSHCFEREKERGTNNSLSLPLHILLFAVEVAGATSSYLLIRLGHVSRLLRDSKDF